MIRSRPLRYLLGGYPVQQGKLNICQPISMSFGSRDYVFTVTGVTMEGHGDFDYIGLLTSVIWSSRLMQVNESGRAPVTGFR